MELDKLTGQKILVTGGTGFAGRYAIRRLVEEGHYVFALVRSKEKLLDTVGKNLEHICLKVIELENPERSTVTDLKRIIEENGITTIIHIAAIAREYPKIAWDKYFETNVLWTRNLALAFSDANISHNKFIFTSTVGVYGTIPKCIPANEETPYNPDGKYHKSKMMAELELLKLKSHLNLPLIIVRPSIMYGFEDFGFLYKLFRLSKKKRYPLSSNNPLFHLLDVETLAEVYVKFVDLEGSEYCIFNVCDKESVAAKTLLDFIKNSLDAGYLAVHSSIFSVLRALFIFNHQRSITFKLISKSWSYNIERLCRTLNFDPKDTIYNLQHKYIKWYKGNNGNNLR